MLRDTMPLVAVLTGLALPATALADTMYVPGDFATIQAAISDPLTIDFDEIVVAPGSYNEAIDLEGKRIIVRSSGGPLVTTIDAGFPVDLQTSVIRCADSETSRTEIEGFTLQGGIGTVAGVARRGGALFALGGDPTIRDCIFTANTAALGGAIFAGADADPKFINCLFHGNTAIDGGAFYTTDFSGPTLINCTIVGNSASDDGGGVYVDTANGSIGVFNTILWDNSPDAFDGDDPTVNFSCFFDQVTGIGNTSGDPMFVDPTGPDGDPNTLADNDYSLSPGSPCIDSGNSNSIATVASKDLIGQTRGVDDPATTDSGMSVFGLTVDMGAYEVQIPCTPVVDTCPWDLDNDGRTGLADLTDMLNNWGFCPP